MSYIDLVMYLSIQSFLGTIRQSMCRAICNIISSHGIQRHEQGCQKKRKEASEKVEGNSALYPIPTSQTHCQKWDAKCE